jgi:hypothetical protein
MSQTDDNVKSDKIKALALAKECYAMKLELLTNATVVDDAIRFVTSHAAVPTITEKANSDDRVTVDEEISNRNDVKDLKKMVAMSSNQQGQQQQSTLFSNRDTE